MSSNKWKLVYQGCSFLLVKVEGHNNRKYERKKKKIHVLFWKVIHVLFWKVKSEVGELIV